MKTSRKFNVSARIRAFCITALFLVSTQVFSNQGVHPVFVEVNPDFSVGQSQGSSKVLAIRFDDPFSKTVKPSESVSIQIEAIVGAGTNIPVSPKRISYFLERTEKTGKRVFVGDYRQEGNEIFVTKPGQYILKAVMQGEDVQGGLVYATKSIAVR